MMHKLIALAVASVLSVGVAIADDDKSMKSTDATFKSLDRDTDQRLSKTEAAGDKMLNEHFSAVDADSDGYLSKREVTAHMKDMQQDKPKKDY
jgi:hypothetical protein